MSRTRRVLLLAVIVGTLAACGSDSSILDARGNEARHIAGAWWVMFGLAIAVYVGVAGFIITAVVRGRRRRRPEGAPASDGAFIWIGGIVIPVVVLALVGIVTVRTTAALRKPETRALRVDVHGEDWWWAIHYPASGITTANDLHLPVGRPIELRLTSDNVIHSFWVPQIGGKVDVIPGQPNYFRFTIERAGRYRGQCAEFCGIQHANMAIYLFADPPGLFDRWEAAHAQPPSEPSSELAAQGAVVFQRIACAGCHTVRGTQAVGTKGPDLTMVGSRHTLGAGTLENNAREMRRWITDPQRYKPGALMPAIPLSADDRTKLVAYLLSLR